MIEIESLIAQMKDTVSDMPDDRYYQERIRKAAQRQRMQDTIECDCERFFKQPLGEVIAYLCEIEEKHPGAKLDIDYNRDVAEVEFYRTRQETDAEFASRLERELSHLRFQRAQRDRERGDEVLRLRRQQEKINQRLKELGL